MTYTNNVPQANQRIADTQSPILANFTFLEPCIGQEHNFDDTDATKTYHLQASMPNKVTDPALPAGTDGMYYVKGGVPKFVNSDGANFISMGNAAFTPFNGTITVLRNTIQAIVPNISGFVAGFVIAEATDNTSVNTSSFIKVNGLTSYTITLNNSNTKIGLVWNGGVLSYANSSTSTDYTLKYSGYYCTTP